MKQFKLTLVLTVLMSMVGRMQEGSHSLCVCKTEKQVEIL